MEKSTRRIRTEHKNRNSRSGGADVKEATFKQRRYRELVEMSPNDIEDELREVRSATRLNKPGYHLRMHGPEVGAKTLREFMEPIFSLQRDEKARIFSFRHPKFEGKVHWALVSVERGHVMLYNVTDRVIATFFTHDVESLSKFLYSRRGLWVEVKKQSSGEEYLVIEEWEV
jgi:hypothetical protein